MDTCYMNTSKMPRILPFSHAHSLLIPPHCVIFEQCWPRQPAHTVKCCHETSYAREHSHSAFLALFFQGSSATMLQRHWSILERTRGGTLWPLHTAQLPPTSYVTDPSRKHQSGLRCLKPQSPSWLLPLPKPELPRSASAEWFTYRNFGRQ